MFDINIVDIITYIKPLFKRFVFNKDAISFYAFVVSTYTFMLVQRIRNSQNEIQIRNMISAAKNTYLETAYKVLQIDHPPDSLCKILEATLEDYRNAYEEACSKYIDKKLDQRHFKKMYYSEIKERVERDRDYYKKNKDKFENTLRVYDKWFKKNKIRNWIMKKQKILKRIGIFLLIVFLGFGIFKLSGNWKDFLSVIFVVIISYLLPFLFDKTDTILKLLNCVAESINPAKHQNTINLYNEKLRNFATSFYFFLNQILIDDQKKILLGKNDKELFSFEFLTQKFNELLELKSLKFVRIKDDSGKEVFNDCSYGYLKNAEEELNILFRILNILPPVLDFVSCRNEDFIKMQSTFYKTKNYLTYNAELPACEDLTKELISYIINLLRE